MTIPEYSLAFLGGLSMFLLLWRYRISRYKEKSVKRKKYNKRKKCKKRIDCLCETGTSKTIGTLM